MTIEMQILKTAFISIEFLKMTDGEWVCLRPVVAGKKDLEEGKATCCALHWRLCKLALGRAAASTFTDSRPPIPSRQCGNGASVRAQAGSTPQVTSTFAWTQQTAPAGSQPPAAGSPPRRPPSLLRSPRHRETADTSAFSPPLAP